MNPTDNGYFNKFGFTVHDFFCYFQPSILSPAILVIDPPPSGGLL